MTKVLLTVNNIELKEQDFALFRVFMRHLGNISIMEQKGFFVMKNGSLTIHFDQIGTISSIVKNERVY